MIRINGHSFFNLRLTVFAQNVYKVLLADFAHVHFVELVVGALVVFNQESLFVSIEGLEFVFCDILDLSLHVDGNRAHVWRNLEGNDSFLVVMEAETGVFSGNVRVA